MIEPTNPVQDVDTYDERECTSRECSMLDECQHPGNCPGRTPERKVRQTTAREAVLREGLRLMVGDRDETYGDPRYNLGFEGRLLALLQEGMAASPRRVTAAEQAAIRHIGCKLSRVISGPKLHRDNYVDGASYFALAYEVALGARQDTERT